MKLKRFSFSAKIKAIQSTNAKRKHKNDIFENIKTIYLDNYI